MSEEKLSWKKTKMFALDKRFEIKRENTFISFVTDKNNRMSWDIPNVFLEWFWKKAQEEEREKWKKAVEFFKKYQYVPEYFIRQNPKYLKQVLNVCLCKNKKDLSKLKKGAIVLYDTWLFELASKDLVKG